MLEYLTGFRCNWFVFYTCVYEGCAYERVRERGMKVVVMFCNKRIKGLLQDNLAADCICFTLPKHVELFFFKATFLNIFWNVDLRIITKFFSLTLIMWWKTPQLYDWSPFVCVYQLCTSCTCQVSCSKEIRLKHKLHLWHFHPYFFSPFVSHFQFFLSFFFEPQPPSITQPKPDLSCPARPIEKHQLAFGPPLILLADRPPAAVCWWLTRSPSTALNAADNKETGFSGSWETGTHTHAHVRAHTHMDAATHNLDAISTGKNLFQV